jgi:hypothetical protein
MKGILMPSRYSLLPRTWEGGLVFAAFLASAAILVAGLATFLARRALTSPRPLRIDRKLMSFLTELAERAHDYRVPDLRS